MYIDGHCHLDHPAFDADRAAVLERAGAAGVTGIVLAGVDPAGWARQRALARAPGVWWTAGVHPWTAADLEPDAAAAALLALDEALSWAPTPVAVGEIGLDGRARPREGLDRQAALFRRQLAVARARDLPVVLHVVGAVGRALEITRADGLPRAGGVVHGFTGALEVARAWIELGLHLGIGGAVTRPRAKRLRAAVAGLPGGRLILETDAPDQAPLGVEGRCEPAHLLRIAAAVAELRGEAAAEVLWASSTAARALYRIPG